MFLAQKRHEIDYKQKITENITNNEWSVDSILEYPLTNPF